MLLFFIVWFWNFFNNELMRFEFDKFEYMTFFRFAMSKSITFFNRVMRCNLSNDDNVDENDNDRFFEFSLKTKWKIFFLRISFVFFVISFDVVKTFSLVVLLLNDELSFNLVKMTTFCFYCFEWFWKWKMKADFRCEKIISINVKFNVRFSRNVVICH